MPRQASDDSTSVGRKCLRANVVLPEPLGPIRATRDRLGMEIFMNKVAQHSCYGGGGASSRVRISAVPHSAMWAHRLLQNASSPAAVLLTRTKVLSSWRSK